jgi:glycosyltransferase involved in cell wall biosynthesis
VTDGALVSIVVPVLDEAAALPGLLDHLAGLDGDWEIVICDGGSRDRTPELAAAHPLRPNLARIVHEMAAAPVVGAAELSA